MLGLGFGIIASSKSTSSTSWSAWNGSADVAFASYSTDINAANNGLVLIDIDSTRFMMLYGTETTSFYAVIGTYGTPGSTPTFGTPVLVDNVLPENAVAYDAVLIASNKIYISYIVTFTSTKFAVIANVSGSTITF